MGESVFIIVFIVQLIVLVVFFLMASNVKKIKNKLYQRGVNAKEVWILKEMGREDEAYAMVLRRFLEEIHGYKYSYNISQMPLDEQKEFKELFHILGKDLPNSYEENLAKE